MALHSRPALSNADKYLGARTAEILQPSFDRFSLPMASTGCRHGATAAIMGRRPPGFFWLFAIGELVSNKPCASIAAMVGEW